MNAAHTSTCQPVWKFIANLGDANPVEHGGFAVFTDEAGVYGVEAELLETPEETGRRDWTVRRFSCDVCTFANGVLSANKFHPEKPAWFADKLDAIAETYGQTSAQLVSQFTSSDPVTLAGAWRMIGEYFGYDNLDSYPRYFTKKEIKARWANWS